MVNSDIVLLGNFMTGIRDVLLETAGASFMFVGPRHLVIVSSQ
jgi:hypothetical protein